MGLLLRAPLTGCPRPRAMPQVCLDTLVLQGVACAGEAALAAAASLPTLNMARRPSLAHGQGHAACHRCCYHLCSAKCAASTKCGPAAAASGERNSFVKGLSSGGARATRLAVPPGVPDHQLPMCRRPAGRPGAESDWNCGPVCGALRRGRAFERCGLLSASPGLLSASERRAGKTQTPTPQTRCGQPASLLFTPPSCRSCPLATRTALATPAAAMADTQLDRFEVAQSLFPDYPPGFPYENFDVKELILPDGDNMGINSDDDDIDVEEIETASGFGNIIGDHRSPFLAAFLPRAACRESRPSACARRCQAWQRQPAALAAGGAFEQPSCRQLAMQMPLPPHLPPAPARA